MSGKHVLVFAPYGSWRLHHELDAVMGTALRLRGANLRAMLCDGLFQDCPIAGKPPDPNVCRSCAAGAAALFDGYQIPATQMRVLLGPGDFADAEAWSRGLPVSGLPGARFEGVALGEFVRSSVHTYFMVGELDYSTEKMAEVNRNFLCNGALIVRAFARMLREYPVDHAICYNGVHAYYRIFYELCKARGIPVLIHERGLVDDTFLVLANQSQGDHSARTEAWRPWSQLPLDAAECGQVKDYFIGRERGINTNTEPVYGFQTGAQEARRKLRLPEGKRVIGLFTSSDWEVGISRSIFKMTFASQSEWIEETVKHCVEQDAILVIRHHPNNAREGTLCAAFLKAMLELNRRFPENVRVVMPSEQITSYGLLWSLDLAITYFTTMGAETAIRGIPTLCLAESIYREMGMDYVTDRSDYGAAIRRGLARSEAKAIADLSAAYRFAHYLYFTSNLRFRSYGIKNVHSGEVRIKSAEELLPGNDPALDLVCGHILEGRPLLAPSQERRTRSADAENRFLREEWARLGKVRADARKPGRTHADGSLTVLGPAVFGEPAAAEAWERNLSRSRLDKAALVPATPPDRAGTAAMLRSLAADVARLGSEFVYIGSGNSFPDESVLSASLDYLSDPEHAGQSAVAWGAWVCDLDGDILKAVFEGKTIPAWDDARKDLPLIEEPSVLLSLVVARVPYMAARLGEWARDAERAGGAIAAQIYAEFFGNPRHSAPMGVPSLALYPEKTDAEMEEAELAFLFEMAGELGKAERHYRKAIQAKPDDRASRERYTEVLMRMGREEEAGRIAGGRQEPVRDASWSPIVTSAPTAASVGDAMLKRISLPPAGQSAQPVQSAPRTPPAGVTPPRDYAEIASRVESVKGWLLAGQEKYLFDKVRSLPDGAVVIEMGANKGRSTCAMAFACVGTRKRIYSIDTFSGNDGAMGRDNDFETEWYGNLKRLGLEGYCIPLKGFTFDVLPHRDRFPAPHFVFIDASHEYMDVLSDFKGIYDYVVDGGWIAFHDVEANWPGPWRVWLDYALHLLTDHEQVATLACGRKPKTLPFTRAPGARLGFSYSEALIRELEGRYSGASPLCRALRTSLEGRQGTAQEAQALAQAEVRIAEAPESDFRSHLVNMMSVKDGGIDGHIRLWYGLNLIAEGKVPEAYTELMEATRASYPVPEHRVSAYLALVRQGAQGKPLPEVAQGDPAAAAYREFVRPGDTVVEFLSGKGALLRGLSCARRLGVEPDRENRRQSIADFGIDSVEAAADLPDACADLIFCHEKLDQAEAPLVSLRELAPKLKRGGKLVVTMREGAASLYSWSPASLANLLRAAGYSPVGAAHREGSGGLRMTAEKT